MATYSTTYPSWAFTLTTNIQLTAVHFYLICHIHVSLLKNITQLSIVKMGKSAGLDSLAAEHFVYSHSSATMHLSLLLPVC